MLIKLTMKEFVWQTFFFSVLYFNCKKVSTNFI